ncbi:hypothetical protein UA08_06880A, partial [Talaromyces atroroseus]
MSKVTAAWGAASLYLVGEGISKNKAAYYNALATTCPTWEDARHYFNRVLYDRRVNHRRGQSFSMIISTADAKSARDLAQGNAQPPVLSSNELQHLNSITGETYDFDQYGLLAIRAYTRAQLADSSIITSPYSGEPGYAETIGEVTEADTPRPDRMGLGSSRRPGRGRDGQVVSPSNRPKRTAVEYNDNDSIDDIDIDGVRGDDIQSNHEPMHNDPEPHSTANSGPPAPEHIGDDDALMVDSTNPEHDESGASGPPVPERMGDDDALMVDSTNPERDESGASGPPVPERMGDDDALMVDST